jgi:DNA-binding NarL/FixJ family response regulator
MDLVQHAKIRRGSFRRRGDSVYSLDVIRVLTVDDHPLLRGGISNAVNAQSGMIVVAEAADGEQAIAMHRKHRPDITLMDLRLPKTSGIDAISAIRSECPRARIIVLTTYAGDVQALRAMKAGAQGYILKNMLGTELIDTIRIVHSGHRRIPPEIASEMALHASDDALSDREVDVLRSVAAGNSNKTVADELFLSEQTVKGHVRNILSKLGANDRTGAVMIALKRGILEL